jgi:Cys-tRNA(Pro)/Cys-tRNA(Cys) deacylase
MGARATPATTAAAAAGVTVVTHEYDVDHTVADYGVAVAQAIGQDVDRVFKTLVVEVDGTHLAVGVVPVAARLDLKALAAALGGRKAEMADPTKAERTTGYVVGGISPLGQKKALPTVIDETVELYDTVFVSAGKRGLQIEIAPTDLIALTSAQTAAIAR